VASTYRSDGAFVGSIEQELPAGAMVLELPYLSFPEAQNSRFGGRLSAAMGDYDHFREYLHSSRIHWSYGSMRGREADWAFVLQRLSVPATVLAAVADGFQGLVIDRAAYYDAGRDIEAKLRRVLGAEPTASPDGTLSFFDLRGYQRRLAGLKEAQVRAVQWATLFPLRMEIGGGFWPPERGLSHVWHWSRRAQAELRLVNPSRMRRAVVITAVVKSAGSAPVPVRITTPDGSTKRIEVNDRGAKLALELVLPPGVTVVGIDASRIRPFRPAFPDMRYPLFLLVEQLRVREATFAGELGPDARLRPLLHVTSEDDFQPH
jgi:hypothetical protein